MVLQLGIFHTRIKHNKTKEKNEEEEEEEVGRHLKQNIAYPTLDTMFESKTSEH